MSSAIQVFISKPYIPIVVTRINSIYYRPTSTNPPLTYLPPGPSNFVRQSRQIDPELIEDINNLIQPGASDFHSIESSLLEDQEQAIDGNDLLIRRKRALSADKEIISITLNFKGYQFS